MTEETIDVERIMTGEDAKTSKQCGTCKWWNTNHVNLGAKISNCMNIKTGDQWLKPRNHNEGQDCPVYEKRKE